MSVEIPIAFLLAAAGSTAAGTVVSSASSDEFRVTMLLLAGTAFGIAACLLSAKKEEESKMSRALIGLIGGPAIGFLLDMIPWIPWKLHMLPYILVAFFGMVCATGMYFVGYAGLRKTRKSEDVILTAAEDMARKRVGLPPGEVRERVALLEPKNTEDAEP